MKVVYYVVRCLQDSNAYSIREKRLKDAKSYIMSIVDNENMSYLRREYIQEDNEGRSYFEVEKIVIEYSDGFDLVTQLMSEGCADHTEEKTYKYYIKN